MEKITLYVSRQDFVDAEKFQIRSPLLVALQRWTGTLWRLHDGGCLLEAMHPFRTCQLSTVLLQTLEEYGQNENLYPLLVELEFQPSGQSNEQILMQNHHCSEMTQEQQIHLD